MTLNNKFNSINKSLQTDHTKAVIAFNTVVNILDKWQCSTEQKITILGLRRSTYFKYAKKPESAQIDVNLLERLSYILNIHASLRILFSAPDSVYGWVNKPNFAPLFGGRSAMEKMLTGRVADLADVSRYLNAQRGGWS